MRACHWTFDGTIPALPTSQALEDFFAETIKAIRMTPITEPRIEFHPPNVSAIQFIAESHLAVSIYGTSAFVDIFSCKDFDPGVVLSLLVKHLGGRDWNVSQRRREVVLERME